MTDTLISQYYLALDMADDPASASLIETPRIACVRLSVLDDGVEAVAAAERLCAICHTREIPLLIAGETETAISVAQKAQADGVHLIGAPRAVPWVREQLGEDVIVGIDALNSRHDALTAADDGADYIALAPEWEADETVPDEVSWWSQMIETPMVVENGQSVSRAQALEGVAEFIVITPKTAPDLLS